jgi:hypothetical protein
MKKMSVIASSKEVIENLEWYLQFRKFTNIHINHSVGEIVAERKKFFGKKHTVNLKVIQVNEGVTNIELCVDPELKGRSSQQEQLEEKLRDKIYDYL